MTTRTNSTNHYLYHGFSMRGTFRSQDDLIVEPVTLSQIRAGDVVVFRMPGAQDSSPVVHRVIRVVPGGLLTRGDFNLSNDTNITLEEDLLGRVIYVERQGTRRRVRGGRWGQFRGRVLTAWGPSSWRVRRWLFVHIVAPVGRPGYRLLRKSHLVARFWQPGVTAYYQDSPAGPVVKYRRGRRVVAYWWVEKDYFQIKKPYDLVLRQQDLVRDLDRLRSVSGNGAHPGEPSILPSPEHERAAER